MLTVWVLIKHLIIQLSRSTLDSKQFAENQTEMWNMTHLYWHKVFTHLYETKEWSNIKPI